MNSVNLCIMKIRVQPMSGGEPLNCYSNVQKRIRALGGKMAFGWMIRDDRYYRIRVSHVVWESPDGELVCVTPQFTGLKGETAIIEYPEAIDFERDDAAQFTEKALDNVYEALVDDARIKTACDYMTRADRCMRLEDLERCRYWTERANALSRKSVMRGGWDVPDSLGFRDILKTMIEDDEAAA
jgi:hypothetical protein